MVVLRRLLAPGRRVERLLRMLLVWGWAMTVLVMVWWATGTVRTLLVSAGCRDAIPLPWRRAVTVMLLGWGLSVAVLPRWCGVPGPRGNWGRGTIARLRAATVARLRGGTVAARLRRATVLRPVARLAWMRRWRLVPLLEVLAI